MANFTGSNVVGGTNQSADNTFGNNKYWFEWIDLGGSTSNLTDAGFDISDGSLDTATVYNAGSADNLDALVATGAATYGSDNGIPENGAIFGVRAVTNLEVSTGGTYTFRVNSDDGYRLYVDGVQVVQDDGLHAPRLSAGSVNLGPGEHEIVIIYFENTGRNVLEVDISGPDYPSGTDLNNANISANRGEDSVRAGEGNDTIEGGGGDDTLRGQLDDDSLNGGTGQDLLAGGSGDDALFGGAGADNLRGGNDDDLLDGGSDSDTLQGGDGFDTFVASSGNDTITDFNTGTGQNINDGDQSNNDFLDLSAYYDNLSEVRQDLLDDGILNQSNTVDTNGNAVDYSDNTALAGTITLQGAGASDLTFDTVNLCFTTGTLIATAEGARAIETLEVGDMVQTMDHGLQPVRWIWRRAVPQDRLQANPKLRPVMISAGALGAGLPERDLRVSRQHRMLLISPVAERMFGCREVLVPAIKLADVPVISVDQDAAGVEYFHLLFDQHEVVLAEGCPSESLYTGPEALASLEVEAREELQEIFPEIFEPDYEAQAARILPAGKKQKKLIERHISNNKEMLAF